MTGVRRSGLVIRATWEPRSQALNEGKVAQSLTTQSLPEMPTLALPGRACFSFSLGAASHPLCWSKLSRADPPGLGRTYLKNLPLGCAGQACRRGTRTFSWSQTIAFEGDTL